MRLLWTGGDDGLHKPLARILRAGLEHRQPYPSFGRCPTGEQQFEREAFVCNTLTLGDSKLAANCQEVKTVILSGPSEKTAVDFMLKSVADENTCGWWGRTRRTGSTYCE